MESLSSEARLGWGNESLHAGRVSYCGERHFIGTFVEDLGDFGRDVFGQHVFWC